MRTRPAAGYQAKYCANRAYHITHLAPRNRPGRRGKKLKWRERIPSCSVHTAGPASRGGCGFPSLFPSSFLLQHLLSYSRDAHHGSLTRPLSPEAVIRKRRVTEKSGAISGEGDTLDHSSSFPPAKCFSDVLRDRSDDLLPNLQPAVTGPPVAASLR